jgi:hypothetical protein
MDTLEKTWDIFVSHASEDKKSFVRPLAVALRQLGASVWYDEFSLRLGDSLSRSIDKGLAKSRYGLVIISPHFLAKPWPEYELRGLVSREIGEDRVILPIWHGVTRKQVLDFSPPLADKIALKTADSTAQDIAIQVLRDVRPDLYDKHPRAYLEKLASGEALTELQEQIEKAQQELEAAQEELSEYRCPYCQSALTARNNAPVDSSGDDWDTVEIFACGYEVFAGEVQQPCPSDPRFPRFEDFELTVREEPKDTIHKWRCYARGKTDMARRLQLSVGVGQTREEAESRVRESYERYAKKY